MKKAKMSLHEIEMELAKRANQAEVKQPYWLSGEDDDQGINYCRDCILRMNSDAKYGNDYDGGFIQEEDGVTLCEECGVLLNYTLCNVDQELGYFEEYGWNWDNLNDCFELDAILGGIVRDDKERMRRFVKVARRGANPPILERV